MINFDVINWNAVHIMQAAVTVLTVINIFLIKRECKY